jgi:DNA-3-methyladenine glycosylase II
MQHTEATVLKDETHFTLTIPEPFNFQLTVAKPAGWNWSTLNETFDNGIFRSGIYLNARPTGLKMSASQNRVEVTAYSELTLSGGEISSLKSIVLSGLGAGEDLPAFYEFARDDRILAATVKDLYGMRIGTLDDVFGWVILAILLQMAPLSRSKQMMAAILDNYGRKIIFDGQELVLWPGPEDIDGIGEDELKNRAKLGYRAKRLILAAQFLKDHPVSLMELSALSDDEALKRLMDIPGIGKYSAGIIYGRTAVPIDSWSVVVMSELILGQTPQNPRQDIDTIISKLTERWGKWSFFAFVYIANDLENLAKTFKLSRIS